MMMMSQHNNSATAQGVEDMNKERTEQIRKIADRIEVEMMHVRLPEFGRARLGYINIIELLSELRTVTHNIEDENSRERMLEDIEDYKHFIYENGATS